MMQKTEKSTLIITSMHRSGSSLTASILQSAGLHIGRKLMEGTEYNTKGYFENLDFYEFHKQVLQSQGIDEDGWTLQEKIDIEENFQEKAKEIIAKNSISVNWGWKEPRTTLFLDFWAELLPNAKFILIYRSPWEVVDSLYARQDKIFQSQPELAVKLWLNYNQKIIDFYNHAVNRCLLTNIQTIIDNQQVFVEKINQKFKTNFNNPAVNVYEPSLFNNRILTESHRPTIIDYYFPEATEMYQELEARAWKPEDEIPDFSWQEKIKSSPYRIWAFQDWMNLSSLENQNKILLAELEKYKTQYEQNQLELTQTKSQLTETRDELEKYVTQLDATETTLLESQKQLQATETSLEKVQSEIKKIEHIQTKFDQKENELATAKSQLHQTQAELTQCQSKLEQIESELQKSQATQQELLQTKSLLHQTQGELVQYQSQLHQTQEELEQSIDRLQYQQTQAELGVTKQNLCETKNELLAYKYQLHQTQEEWEKSYYQLTATEVMLQANQAELTESNSQLQKTKQELEKSVLELQKTRQELEQTQAQLTESNSQLKQKETLFKHSDAQLKEIQKSQNEWEISKSELQKNKQELQRQKLQIQELQTELVGSNSQLQQTETLLQKSHSQLQQTKVLLTEFQTQLHQTDEERENLQMQLQETKSELDKLQYQQAILRNSKSEGKTEYKLLVWEAWYAYQNDNLAEMQERLQKSLKYTETSRTEIVMDWLDSFANFSQTKAIEFDSEKLTNSEEWQKLMKRTMKIQNKILVASDK